MRWSGNLGAATLDGIGRGKRYGRAFACEKEQNTYVQWELLSFSAESDHTQAQQFRDGKRKSPIGNTSSRGRNCLPFRRYVLIRRGWKMERKLGRSTCTYVCLVPARDKRAGMAEHCAGNIREYSMFLKVYMHQPASFCWRSCLIAPR